MAEYFSGASISHGSYSADRWTSLYEVRGKTLGVSVTEINVTNVSGLETTNSANATFQMRVVNRDGEILDYVSGPRELEGRGGNWYTKRLIILKPGDSIQFRGSSPDFCVYATLVCNVVVTQ